MNNEHYRCDEYQKIDEFKKFEAEQYKTIDVNKTGPENYHTSEYGNQSTSKKKAKSNDDNIIKKFIQKVNESASIYAGSIAVTAAVLVITVVTMSALITNPPTIEILDLDASLNEVSYNILLEDLTEDVNYYVNITNNIDNYEFELFEGENINKINNLSSGYLYKLNIIGRGSSETVTYYTTEFYTLTSNNSFKVSFMSEGNLLQEKYLESGEIPFYDGTTPIKQATSLTDYRFVGWDKTIEPITEDIVYNAVYEETTHYFKGEIYEFTSADFNVTWNEVDVNNISIDTGFNNTTDNRVFYELILFNDDLGVEEIYRGTDQIANIKVSNEIYNLFIKYRIIGLFDEVEIVLEEKILKDASGSYDVLDFSPPYVLVDELLTYNSEDNYSVNYLIESEFSEDIIESLTLTLDYILDDGSVLTDQVTYNNDSVELNQNIKLDLDLYYDVQIVSFNFTYVVNSRYGNNPRTVNYQTNSAIPTLVEINEIIVDNPDYGSSINLYGDYSISGNQVIVIENVTNKQTYTTTYLPTTIDLAENCEFKYYVGTLNDDQVTYTEETTPVSFNVQSGVTGRYSWSYKNPSDVLKTYNEDGTVNIYINGEFSSDESDVYWMVLLETYEHDSYADRYTTKANITSSQESIISIENIPNESYGLIYHVYKLVDNVKYSLTGVAVSGTLGDELYLDLYKSDNPDNELMYSITVSINSYITFKKDSIKFKIVDIDGNESIISIPEEELLYVDDQSIYVATYNGENGFTSGSVFVDVALYVQDPDNVNSYEYLSQYIEVKGSLYNTIEKTI